MSASDLAGRLPPDSMLVDVNALLAAYRDRPSGPVAFGTSGHRGSSLQGTFNEAHILAISEAVSRHRAREGIDGPLFLARDTHALSAPAFDTAIEVFLGHGIDVRVDADDGYTPTPALSHAILTHNREGRAGLADGVVLTPSHNPPGGGPAGSDVTGRIEAEANRILEADLEGVERDGAGRGGCRPHDYVGAYVGDLGSAIDMDAIRGASVKLGVDPLGGASVAYWPAIRERYGLDVTVVNDGVDPTFRFVPVDHDGKVRMDCSSPYAMAGLIGLRDRFDVAVASDPDADRHGVVTREAGLLNPNHFLAAAIAYLFGGARDWPARTGVGKTLVSSSIIDRVCADLDRPLLEMPVGFKWFVDGLLDGSLGFGGEESAGASFLRRDGRPWSTDKDGILLGLLAAEMTARSGRDPGAAYDALAERFGRPAYRRVDAPVSPEGKRALATLAAGDVASSELAGEPIREVLTHARGNGAPIGGLKVVAESGWFAARPSGTEDIYKLYAESFRGEEHLERIIGDAQRLVDTALDRATGP